MQAAIESPVAASTAGWRQPIGARQLRQRPRRSRNESTGTLSRLRIGSPQPSQADGGCTIETPAGSREATTFRKLPSASPGARTTAAKSGPTDSYRQAAFAAP